MKVRVAALLLVLHSISASQAEPKTLPPSCGDDKSVIEVTTHKHGPALLVPETGKAKVVFIETADKNALPVTTRFALDGSWLGANKGNSYFEAAIEPGEHHVCADWQLNRRFIKDRPAFEVFTAEAGKIYFFMARVGWDPSVVMVETREPDGNMDLRLSSVNEDEGRYLVQNSKFSTAIQKNKR